MKKIIGLICIAMVSLLLTGCGNKVENIEGTLPEIMEKLYSGIPEEEMPMMVENTELNDENFKYFAFADVKYKEAIASESMTGSIPHSVVLIRLENASDAEAAVEEIKKNADPRKWICVEAENTFVLSKGDLVVLIMSNDMASKIKENFENLK
ncbi:MAG: hypothetical protein HFJ02_00905 [Bacilli bacterium]|jgi:hypothetical protein|nr:hypothetical protein [Bacilli bacterium]